MSEKRFIFATNEKRFNLDDESRIWDNGTPMTALDIVMMQNEQQELIEELQVSDEMGWNRAEHFEKKCPKELHNKKMYIKRLEYKVQKFKEMNSEQQDTIRKLQDLCGESDSENAKLRIENKKLKEMNEQLKELLKNYEYQIEKGYTDLTYEEILEKESESDE